MTREVWAALRLCVKFSSAGTFRVTFLQRMKRNSKSGSQLPFVYLNVATTADGKIAPTHHKYVQFSSDYDQKLLLELRTRADAVMCGASTINSFPIDLGPGGKKYRAMRLKNGLAEYNLRIVVSGSARVDPNAEVFKYKFSPLIVLITDRAPRVRVKKLEATGAIVRSFGKETIDFKAACRWLYSEWKVKRLLCEGGGEVNWGLLDAGVVNEIYHTLCPVILGGRNAPTMADGEGVTKLSDALKLKLKSCQRIGDEFYLVHQVLPR